MPRRPQGATPQVIAMQQTGIHATIERKNSMVHLFDKSDQLYQRKDPKKLRIEEFSSEVSFKYGVPMIILDLINALTGAEMIV